jgi:uncharacterized protein with HEPN domain
MPIRRTPTERLGDIADAIRKIEQFLSGKTFEEFSTEELIHDAVVRNLEIISEASRHLDNTLKARAPEVSWRKAADMGNWLRHGYDVVSDRILWETIEDDLPILAAAVRRLVRGGGAT